MPSRRLRAPVLVLRRVALRLDAGVPGCSAVVRPLRDLHLVVHGGERVLVADAPADVATWLLFVAAGLARPPDGVAWSAPGARLAHPSAPVRGVAESPAVVHRAVWWPGANGAELAVTAAALAAPPTRIVRIRGGRLCGGRLCGGVAR